MALSQTNVQTSGRNRQVSSARSKTLLSAKNVLKTSRSYVSQKQDPNLRKTIDLPLSPANVQVESHSSSDRKTRQMFDKHTRPNNLKEVIQVQSYTDNAAQKPASSCRFLLLRCVCTFNPSPEVGTRRCSANDRLVPQSLASHAHTWSSD